MPDMSEQDKADLSKKRGHAAAAISDPAQRQKFIAAQGEAEAKGKADYQKLGKEAEETEATQGQNIATMRSYAKGTSYVPSTGPAIVHEGEKIIPAKEKPMAKKRHNVSLYRAMHHLNKGGLHRALGVPEGEKIPAEKLAAARNSKNEHVAHMAKFAHTMSGFKH
jgi:hypothetical protein